MQTINASTTSSSAIHSQNIFRLRLRHEPLFCHQMIFFCGATATTLRLLFFAFTCPFIHLLLFLYYGVVILFYRLPVYSELFFSLPFSFLFRLLIFIGVNAKLHSVFCILYIVCSCFFFHSTIVSSRFSFSEYRIFFTHILVSFFQFL